MTHGQRAFAKLRTQRGFLAASLVVALLASIALFAELLAADAPIVAIGRGRLRVLAGVTEPTTYAVMTRDQIDSRHAEDFALWPLVRQGPERTTEPRARASLQHPLGTDATGRDVFANIVYGARSSVGPALAALLLSVALGATMGALAGARGGSWDELVARPTEIFQAFPTVLVVALAMAIDPGRSGWTLVFSAAAVRWAELARGVRADTLRLVTDDSITAARAIGASPFQIIRRHIWPRTAPTLLASAVATLPSLVALEAAVAYLGVGLPASWGSMIAKGTMAGGSAWSAGCATAVLFLTVAATAMLADAAAGALTPQIRRAPS